MAKNIFVKIQNIERGAVIGRHETFLAENGKVNLVGIVFARKNEKMYSICLYRKDDRSFCEIDKRSLTIEKEDLFRCLYNNAYLIGKKKLAKLIERQIIGWFPNI